MHSGTVAILARACALEPNSKPFLFCLRRWAVFVCYRSVDCAFVSSSAYVMSTTSFQMMAIPSSILDGWEDAGSTLRLIIEYVGVSNEVMGQLTEATGIDAEGPAVDLAYIRDDEWEEAIMQVRINESPP